jgi:hypothetical protein
MPKANITPRAAPSKQAPNKSFISIPPLKVAPVGAGYINELLSKFGYLRS